MRIGHRKLRNIEKQIEELSRELTSDQLVKVMDIMEELLMIRNARESGIFRRRAFTLIIIFLLGLFNLEPINAQSLTEVSNRRVVSAWSEDLASSDWVEQKEKRQILEGQLEEILN